MCPPGPGATTPKAGTYSTVPTTTAGELKVLWTTPADAGPQAPQRTGYVVTARAKSAAAPSKFVSALVSALGMSVPGRHTPGRRTLRTCTCMLWTGGVCKACTYALLHCRLMVPACSGHQTVHPTQQGCFRPILARCTAGNIDHGSVLCCTALTALFFHLWQTEVGQYIADAGATSTVLTLPGSPADAAAWTVKVRSEVAGEDLSTPFPLSSVRVSCHIESLVSHWML